MVYKVNIRHKQIDQFLIVQGSYGVDEYEFVFDTPLDSGLDYYVKWENQEGKGSSQELVAIEGANALSWTPNLEATAVAGSLSLQIYGLLPAPAEEESRTIVMPDKTPGEDATVDEANAFYDGITASFDIPVTKDSTVRITGYGGQVDSTIDCSKLEWNDVYEPGAPQEQLGWPNGKHATTEIHVGGDVLLKLGVYIGAKLRFPPDGGTPGLCGGNAVTCLPESTSEEALYAEHYSATVTVMNPASGEAIGKWLTEKGRARVLPSIDPVEMSSMDKDQFDAWLTQAKNLVKTAEAEATNAAGSASSASASATSASKSAQDALLHSETAQSYADKAGSASAEARMSASKAADRADDAAESAMKAASYAEATKKSVHLEMWVVDELPTASADTIYGLWLVPEASGDSDVKAEYVTIKTISPDGSVSYRWEKIGSTALALKDYSKVGHTHVIADVTGLQTALDGKQSKLTFDSAPTADSSNPVTSGGVKAALDVKADTDEVSAKVSKSGDIMTGALMLPYNKPTFIYDYEEGFYSTLSYRTSDMRGLMLAFAKKNASFAIMTGFSKENQTSGNAGTIGYATPAIQVKNQSLYVNSALGVLDEAPAYNFEVGGTAHVTGTFHLGTSSSITYDTSTATLRIVT